MEKVFHEKSSEEKILPEYFFHLEQIYIDKCTVGHNNVVFPPILRHSIHIKEQRAGNDDMHITY